MEEAKQKEEPITLEAWLASILTAFGTDCCMLIEVRGGKACLVSVGLNIESCNSLFEKVKVPKYFG